MAVVRYLQGFASRKPGVAETIGGAILLVAAASAGRWVLDALTGEHACFALYFPAILASALLLGWRAGVIALILSAFATDYLRIGPPAPMAVRMVRGDLMAAEYWLSATIIIATAELLRRTLAKLSTLAQSEQALNLELRHRVNNSLAMAVAFASQTRRSAPDPDVFFTAFQSRLTALARANDILSSEDLRSCHVRRLAETALEAFAGHEAVTLAGAQCFVPSPSCVPLVLALHELATNAVKHGALSTPGGTVLLSWTVRTEGARCDIVLRWIERDGPPVAPPTRKGLGSRLLVRQGGLDEVEVQFAPAGLRCTMVVRGVSVAPVTPVGKPHAAGLAEA
jgi:two-component sensor histidine kinase